jgi:para-aminobenzoate synthetase component 1
MKTVASPLGRRLKATVREVAWPADAEAVFACLAARPGCVWLDSAGGPAPLARWSVLAAEPSAVLVHADGATRLTESGGRLLDSGGGSPFEKLRQTLAAMAFDDEPPMPLPFGPGLYGYLSYDLAPWIEPKATLSPRRDIALPDLWLGVYESVLVLDHQEQRAYLAGGDGPAFEAIREAKNCGLRIANCGLEETTARLLNPQSEIRNPQFVAPPLSCNMTREEFLRAVERAREYIAAGDIYQVNLSRRYAADLAPRPSRGAPAEGTWAELYRRLRRANPAPYAACLGLGAGQAILSSSPELFLALEGGRIVTRPIKGTRPHRPGDEAFNARMRAELLKSEKDRAELVMIVDLERNDLGRVASYGSVRVTEPRAIETYAAVHHTVATVEGRLHDGRDLVDLLKATFPGGSITGAPKVRAMQIIAELEPTRRSAYTGAIGYLAPPSPANPAGRSLLNVAIRTLLVSGGQVHLQVGGGIVADSQPEAEFEETEDKARALLAALAG